MLVADLQGLSPFHLAAVSGSAESVQITIQGVQVPAEILEMRTMEGLTPLMLAAQAGHVQVVAALLQAGCDVNALEELMGRTALHFAAENGRDGVVELLLKGEVVLDLPDSRGRDRERERESGNCFSFALPNRADTNSPCSKFGFQRCSLNNVQKSRKWGT